MNGFILIVDSISYSDPVSKNIFSPTKSSLEETAHLFYDSNIKNENRYLYGISGRNKRRRLGNVMQMQKLKKLFYSPVCIYKYVNSNILIKIL